jgi:hypothetical protein
MPTYYLMPSGSLSTASASVAYTQTIVTVEPPKPEEGFHPPPLAHDIEAGIAIILAGLCAYCGVRTRISLSQQRLVRY